jgi:uncharacterized protein
MNAPSNPEPLLPFDGELLISLARSSMPFGKYQGRLLIDLPEPYILWFADKGFPKGKLGQQMALLHTIKVNGLEKLLDPMRR